MAYCSRHNWKTFVTDAMEILFYIVKSNILNMQLTVLLLYIFGLYISIVGCSDVVFHFYSVFNTYNHFSFNISIYKLFRFYNVGLSLTL